MKRRLSTGDAVVEPRQTRSSSLMRTPEGTSTARKRRLTLTTQSGATKKARINSPAKVSPRVLELSGETDQDDDGLFLDDSQAESAEEEINLCKVSDHQLQIPQMVAKPRVTVSCRFLEKPLPKEEALKRWPQRYKGKHEDRPSNSSSSRARKKHADTGDEEQCINHYRRAEVDNNIYELGDCVHVNADTGSDYLGRITEFFELKDRTKWFCCRWFFRVEDTGIGKDLSNGIVHDPQRVFYSEEVDDNALECIVEKKKVIRISSPPRLRATKHMTPKIGGDYFYDMGYNPAYSTFYTLPEDIAADSSEESTSRRDDGKSTKSNMRSPGRENPCDDLPELSLLDLYSGCGAMSTGLCNGCGLAGATIVSKWAVDLNEYACESLRHNHPETQVRTEAAEDFLALIKAWKDLCDKYANDSDEDEGEENDGPSSGSIKDTSVYEVEALVDIRWAGVTKLEQKLGKRKSPTYVEKKDVTEKPGLEFRVKWKYFPSSDDTWEPQEHLDNCSKKIKEFVIEGQKKKILPLPGHCDVICGGPPCQGASGFNRFRNTEEPLKCIRNKQIIVYMDIVQFLKPRFVLMENVVDILKFADGKLGRYALSRLVQMHYQAKLGLLVAGCYGLPQFRMRVFLWGAAPSENLPAYPLPTHSVVSRGHAPQSWERNVVAYDDTESPHLEDALVLKDAISDLPKITNDDKNDEMDYDKDPLTVFQRLIRAPKYVLNRKPKPRAEGKPKLYDHRCLNLSTDDHQRVCKIPKRKGANFRDLEGIKILPDGTVDVDRKKRILLPSGKPLVPEYAITFVKGKSLKPFGRLWWDETVSTVVTRAEPHNIAILHPNQDRTLSIRENARLQGFPDWYKLHGNVKERYIQVGNAVAVPVARALGYALGKSIFEKVKVEPIGKAAVMKLPPKFPYCLIDVET